MHESKYSYPSSQGEDRLDRIRALIGKIDSDVVEESRGITLAILSFE